MRRIRIDSNKAAYDRLFWLRSPLDMAVPFDMAEIAPFSVQVLDEPKRMQLRYKDKVIGQVGPHMPAEDGFHVSLTLPASETLDRAVTSVFTRLRAHLDLVGRAVAEERRVRRADPNTPNPSDIRAQARRDKAENARREREEQDRRHAEWMQKICDGFQIAQRPYPDLVKITGLSDEDVQNLSRLTSRNDVLSIENPSTDILNQKTFWLRTKSGQTWRFYQPVDEGTYVYVPSDKEHAPDMSKVAPVIHSLRERASRLMDTDRQMSTLSRLPAAEYSISQFLLVEGSGSTGIGEVELAKLGEDARFSSWGSTVRLRVENVLMCQWDLKAAIEGEVPSFVGRPTLTQQNALFNDSDLIDKLGSIWLERACQNKEIDASHFRVLDMDEVEADAAGIDFGYGFN